MTRDGAQAGTGGPTLRTTSRRNVDLMLDKSGVSGNQQDFFLFL